MRLPLFPNQHPRKQKRRHQYFYEPFINFAKPVVREVYARTYSCSDLEWAGNGCTKVSQVMAMPERMECTVTPSLH
jgi:hypothetical protein